MKRAFRILIIWSVITSVFYGLVSISRSSFPFSNKRVNPVVDLSKNYFQSIEEIVQGGFLVSNAKCRIPDIDPWNAGVLPLISKPPDFKCHEQPYFNLTFVVNSILIINELVLEENGFGIDDVSCCYQLIERVSQTLQNYDKDADNNYSFSECYQMEKATTPKGPFLKVSCKSKSLFKSFTYTNYHLVAVVPPEKNISLPNSTSPPPNILIIGLDSTSRLNMRRFLPKTVKFLNSLGSIELKGYTKVGENTFPNMVPFFTSYSEDDLRNICYPSRWHPQDDCPYIWKRFNEMNYLTVELEDSPEYSVFNYMKTAFIKKPFDIYIRPLMLALYNDKGSKPDCLRYQRPEELILNYIVDLVSLSHSNHLPFFIYTWLTDLTHDALNNIQLADDLLSSSLSILESRGHLRNTILILMGDHGYRFLDIRSTASGWFEDKLPAFWITLPQSISSQNPDWVTSLKSNTNQLVTPFDIYELFAQIFNKYVGPDKPILRNSSNPAMRGLSPLKPIPERTCEEAGIPEDYCPCSLPVEYKSNNTFIQSAANHLVSHINAQLPPECEELSAKTVTASGTFSSYLKTDLLPNLLIISIRTDPGDFFYEAHIIYDTALQNFTKIPHILRMNRITRSTSCLSRENKLSYEQLCYCKGYFY